MCGRYVLHRPVDELRAIFAAMSEMPNFAPNWNVAPSQQAPVLRVAPSRERRFDLLQWGLVPHFTTDLAAARRPINARSETAASSGLFRDALARRRCLVPADAFYEWAGEGKSKQAYAAQRADGAPMALAGLWEGWRDADGHALRSFTILTTQACAALAHLHHRMAVVLEPADWSVWLGEVTGDPLALLRPSEAAFSVWKVAARVGNVRNNDAELLMPVSETPPSPEPLPLLRRSPAEP